MLALAELHAWLLATQRAVAAGSGTAKAVDHALKRWPALERYAGSGTLPIDNNPIENASRPIAIGKKNWLFTGSELGRPSCRRYPEPVRYGQAQRT
ncbi:Transposase IS66 family protein [compost metagenome]